MEEVTDEPLYRDRVCGIDIGKAGMAATIRVPSDKDPARRASETREFGTAKREVLVLADWLRSWQVPAVVMEATGDYWKPVFTGWKPRVSSACWLMPGKSRTCPAARGETRLIRGGSLSASSAARSPLVSWPPRSPGSSGSTPGTGGT